MLDGVNPKVADLVKRLAGDKLDMVLIHAEDLILLKGKKVERALADALEKFKLV